MELSPIVLFVYNRPIHTQRTLDALAKNPEAKNSKLYIFCDGPKLHKSTDNLNKISQVYELVRRENRFKTVEVRTNKINKGLASSITEGVSEVVQKYGKVIVLEDDIETSKGFLKYMNDALNFYESNKRVMHISGYMYPGSHDFSETFFYNVPLCWGWATWKRAWQYFSADSVFLWNELKKNKKLNSLDKFGSDYLSSQLAHNITGKLNTWFIKWHASVLLQDGFCLFPKKSLVENIGFDNSGVHNGEHKEFTVGKLSSKIEVTAIRLEENNDVVEVVKSFYKTLNQKSTPKSLKKFVKEKLRGLVFRFFPDLKKVLVYNQKVIQEKTYLGNNVKVYPPSRLSNSIIGSYSYVSENSVINNAVIGKFCSIGANFMAGRGMHPTSAVSTHPMFYSTAQQNGISLCHSNTFEEFKPINIGNDVFIGMNVTVLDGVSIGDGAIIGAGAVVSKDIPPYAIAVGNPIQILKYRFDSDTIGTLRKLKWWDFPKDQLNIIEKHFFDVEAFIKVVKEKKSMSQSKD